MPYVLVASWRAAGSHKASATPSESVGPGALPALAVARAAVDCLSSVIAVIRSWLGVQLCHFLTLVAHGQRTTYFGDANSPGQNHVIVDFDLGNMRQDMAELHTLNQDLMTAMTELKQSTAALATAKAGRPPGPRSCSTHRHTQANAADKGKGLLSSSMCEKSPKTRGVCWETLTAARLTAKSEI